MEKEKSYITEVFKIFQLETSTKDGGYNYKTKLVPISQYEEFPTKNDAMERIDGMDTWAEYVILPVIKRETKW